MFTALLYRVTVPIEGTTPLCGLGLVARLTRNRATSSGGADRGSAIPSATQKSENLLQPFDTPFECCRTTPKTMLLAVSSGRLWPRLPFHPPCFCRCGLHRLPHRRSDLAKKATDVRHIVSRGVELCRSMGRCPAHSEPAGRATKTQDVDMTGTAGEHRFFLPRQLQVRPPILTPRQLLPKPQLFCQA